MAIDERSRHELFVRLEQVLGPHEAATLMEHLPPVGWADVATKRDLEHLRVEVRADLTSLLLEQDRHFTRMLFATVAASTVTLSGVAFAAAKLF